MRLVSTGIADAACATGRFRRGLVGWLVASVTATVLLGCAEDVRVVSPLPSPYCPEFQKGNWISPPVPSSLPDSQMDDEREPGDRGRGSRESDAGSTHPEWKPHVPLSDRWQHIVIHHSDSEGGSLTEIDQWHLRQGWEHGCGYHFVIGNGSRSSNGEVEPSRRWKQQLHGAHTRLTESFASGKGLHFQHYNDHGIGIVLVGDFDRDRPTAQQMEELVELVAFLMDICDIPASRVRSHGEVDQTRCPGRHLNVAALRRRLERNGALQAGVIGP